MTKIIELGSRHSPHFQGCKNSGEAVVISVTYKAAAIDENC